LHRNDLVGALTLYICSRHIIFYLPQVLIDLLFYTLTVIFSVDVIEFLLEVEFRSRSASKVFLRPFPTVLSHVILIIVSSLSLPFLVDLVEVLVLIQHHWVWMHVVKVAKPLVHRHIHGHVILRHCTSVYRLCQIVSMLTSHIVGHEFLKHHGLLLLEKHLLLHQRFEGRGMLGV
jgi:hypothetical protein